MDCPPSFEIEKKSEIFINLPNKRIKKLNMCVLKNFEPELFKVLLHFLNFSCILTYSLKSCQNKLIQTGTKTERKKNERREDSKRDKRSRNRLRKTYR